MEEATWNLLDKGEKIAKEARALKEELTAALQEVRRESEYPEGRQEQPASPQGVRCCSGFVGVLFCFAGSSLLVLHTAVKSELWEAEWLNRQLQGRVPALALLWLLSL